MLDAIEIMSKNAIEHGFADKSLTENVLQRESLSDTSFGDVAIPHSLREDVFTSFLSFSISDVPIQWGSKKVYIILLIGVNKESRKVFARIFDILVEILSERRNVKELASASDYDDFLYKLYLLINNTT